jgi:hypothetical protein
MATGTVGKQPRELPFQAVHYMRKRVNYSDVGISTGIKIGTLPKDANILRTTVKVRTAFNAATTNVLTVGQNSSSYNDIVAAGDVDESAAEAQLVMRGADLDLSASEVDVYAKYTQSGTAATAGVADIMIEFIPNNDA